MPRKAVGAKPMTPAVRQARARRAKQERHQRYEAILRDLLETAEHGRITARHVAAKCREALGN